MGFHGPQWEIMGTGRVLWGHPWEMTGGMVFVLALIFQSLPVDKAVAEIQRHAPGGGNG
jgi:hypothetical protein